MPKMEAVPQEPSPFKKCIFCKHDIGGYEFNDPNYRLNDGRSIHLTCLGNYIDFLENYDAVYNQIKAIETGFAWTAIVGHDHATLELIWEDTEGRRYPRKIFRGRDIFEIMTEAVQWILDHPESEDE